MAELQALQRYPQLRATLADYEFNTYAAILDEITCCKQDGSGGKFGRCAEIYRAVPKMLEQHPELDIFQPAEGRETPGYDDSNWQTIPVPGDWRATLTFSE